MRAYKVTVTATATELVAADNLNRQVYVNVVGNKILAIGGNNVTYAQGLLIAKHTEPIHIELPLGESLWAICDTAETDDVRVLVRDAD